MNANPQTLTVEPAAQRDAMIEKLLKAAEGVFEIYTIYLGDQLGLYEALAEGGPQTSAELADRAGIVERYAREWLEQQTVAGILKVEEPALPVEYRRFYLPAGLEEVLVDRDNPNYLAPLAQAAVAAARPVDKLQEAFRSGGGVPYGEYGRDLVEGQGRMNRNAFLQDLGSEWLPSIPDVHARLSSRQARIADIGTGVGWSSIGMAQAYPKARVDGFDQDGPSIEAARANALEAGLSDRVRFWQADAARLNGAESYDLVTAFECVHDMSDPVGVLSTMRRLAGEDGAVIVMDERTGDEFTENGTEIEPLLYGFSVLHCLPAGMVAENSAGTGTVMRPGTLLRYAKEAGFREVEVLPIENFFFRFYRLHQ